MPYLMESHMGGVYDVDEYDQDDLYCETCGDSDWEIGYYETDKERQKLLDDYYAQYNQ